ncbi:MAG: cation:proton antiporter, partial [Deltaproteobacteria bacterium]|nr:cation:proton antiporter [Deltaproteobacteria bacterium]
MKRLTALFIICLVVFPATALAAGEDPSLHLLFFLVLILVAAKVFGHLAVLLGQPAVLGELLAGILLGNLQLFGIGEFAGIASDPGVDLLARIGVVVLLFQVGLESTIRDILNVGLTSLLVALLGIAAPFGLGWLVSASLLPGHSWHVHAFLGATLSATSVGITARVLQDIGQSRSKEARIILGAAVVDDVLGLIILASISGAIIAAAAGAAAPGIWPQALIALKAAGFLGGSLFLGTLITPKLFSTAARLKGAGVLIGVSLSFCFLLSYLSGLAGLASI